MTVGVGASHALNRNQPARVVVGDRAGHRQGAGEAVGPSGPTLMTASFAARIVAVET